MPSAKHLEWAEITDFAPGIFTAGDWLMPASAAQTMTDCHPEVGGGLRAFQKPVSFPTTNINQTTNRVIGIYSRGGIALRAGVGDANDRYVWTYDSSTTQVKVWRWDETAAVSQWSLIKTHTASNAPNPVIADTFVDAAGVAYVVYTLYQVGADDGIWSIRYSDAAVTKQVASVIPGALAVQDDRIIFGTGSTLRWSDSQSVSSFPAANNLPVQLSRQGSTILAITPFAPSDLYIGTRFSAWTMVQGDITNPIVRTMSDEYTVGWGQFIVQTSAGLAFIAKDQGIIASGNGSTFVELSKQIDRSIWTSPNALNGDVGGGRLGHVAPFLVAPHGYIFDFRTKSWFQSSVLNGAKGSFHSWGDKNTRSLFCATGDIAFNLWVIDADEQARDTTFTWKGAPLRHQSGRQIRIREVQLYGRTYDTDATLAVTVNGVTRSSGVLGAAGKKQVSFLFDESDEVLDVRVVSTAGSTAEAPSLEVVRIGARPGHQLR